MDFKIESSWKEALSDEFTKDYFETLVAFVKEAYQTKEVFPPANEIFKAFELCPFEQVKVVMIGQDPYHGEGQAHGLCFSVNDQVAFPPSLRNIFKEIERDLQQPFPNKGNLTCWASQGVLMLNATLTVEAHQAGSHQGKGWELFTDAVIRKLAVEKENLVFMLWGSFAQRKGAFIDAGKHKVLKTVHPSPLSAYRGFIGCNHFSLANHFLQSTGQKPIKW
jgi:uracil-DNA glycosylase